MGPASGGGDLEAARGGAVSQRGPSSIGYSIVAVAGFEIVPEVVRTQLQATGIIGVTALCASCESLQVRRRANGSHYQTGTAWWGDNARAVLITVRREMEHREGRQYAPKGAWSVSGTVHYLGDGGSPERTTWQFDAAASKEKNSSPPVTTDDPLDLLPPDVAAPVRGGLSDVWMVSSPAKATEYLTAIRVNDREVLLLEANRAARSERALIHAAWVLTTLIAPITKSVPFSFTCDERGFVTGARDLLGDARGNHPLTPGE